MFFPQCRGRNRFAVVAGDEIRRRCGVVVGMRVQPVAKDAVSPRRFRRARCAAVPTRRWRCDFRGCIRCDAIVVYRALLCFCAMRDHALRRGSNRVDASLPSGDLRQQCGDSAIGVAAVSSATARDGAPRERSCRGDSSTALVSAVDRLVEMFVRVSSASPRFNHAPTWRGSAVAARRASIRRFAGTAQREQRGGMIAPQSVRPRAFFRRRSNQGSDSSLRPAACRVKASMCSASGLGPKRSSNAR